jgi:hypothetical protein
MVDNREVEVRFSVAATYFSFFCAAEIGSGVHPASYTADTMNFLPLM